MRPTEHKAISDDLDAVIVVNPDQFSDRQRWELARFLRRGGNLIVAGQVAKLGFNARRGRSPVASSEWRSRSRA